MSARTAFCLDREISFSYNNSFTDVRIYFQRIVPLALTDPSLPHWLMKIERSSASQGPEMQELIEKISLLCLAAKENPWKKVQRKESALRTKIAKLPNQKRLLSLLRFIKQNNNNFKK